MMHFEMELTNHMRRNSTIETSFSCGNCDGANCEGCKQYIILDDNYEFHRVDTLEEAKELIEQMNKFDEDMSKQSREFDEIIFE